MNSVHVLLADDHAVVRAGIRNALVELPMLDIVGEVGDGIELERALAEAQPDLLLIDVTMPNFEPISAIRRIRKKYPDMRILVVSAYDDDVYVQGLLGVGVDGYHLKDQPLQDLRFAVQHVLAGKRWISSPLVDKLLKQPPATIYSHKLSPRQKDILRLLAQGFDNKTMARELCLSIKTIENHLTRLYRQLHVQSRLEAAKYVADHPEVIAYAELSVKRPFSLPVSPPKNVSTILIVDDNQRYRTQLCHTISKVSPQAMIYEAKNIAEAREFARRIIPTIAFVDVVLGDESGIRCTRYIRKEAPQAKIILISAYPDREFHRLGLEAGAIAFVDKKDLDTPTLFQIITDATR